VVQSLFPNLDCFRPESRVRDLGRSWFVTAGIRKFTMALVLMAVSFNVVQRRWPGRGGGSLA